MAYKTSHKLSLMQNSLQGYAQVTNKKTIKEIESYIEDNEDISWVISEGLFEWGEDDRSFTNKNKHMKKLSKTYPNIIFVLEYEPVNDGELGETREYWFDGLCQHVYARITIDEFDVNKLIEVK